MRRKVNNSETHEIKRYYKVPSEKVQEWSDTIENLTKQSDQFKAERDTLIDDLSWYKAKVSRLEDESSKYIDLLEEFSQHIGNKPSSSTYKYFREKLDELGIKEGE
ncbi:hypothetical protein QI060_00235 [Staphylococcus saprophyticus]|uniref:Uncharacterized protein n=1 Tax=uncultured Caudovirales phage TaxID=2100421 RepID=A0A2H4JHH5_9CAUD|nr:hypothetical protein 10F4_10 [uncultured Caudovirales phage]MDW4300733.1 hypothetical protein [Staphylococcus saprophyticus]